MSRRQLTLFQNDRWWVINKPARSHFDELLEPQDAGQWLPAHRLDYETSGCLLLTRPSLEAEARQLFKSSVSLRKLYLAGASQPLPRHLSNGSEISGFIASRYRSSKRTHFVENEHKVRGWHSCQPCSHRIFMPSSEAVSCVAGHFGGHAYEVELLTGARHQIRAYFAQQKAPLCGDPVYGTAKAEQRLELHAWKLEFEDPLAHGEWIRCTATLP